MQFTETFRFGVAIGKDQTWYPTNVDLLKLYAFAGFEWAIKALPEAIRNAELRKCETYWGGCI